MRKREREEGREREREREREEADSLCSSIGDINFNIKCNESLT